MKKLILGLVAVVGVLIGGLLGFAMMQPDVLHVERSVSIAAAPVDVAPHINNLKKFTEWSPWSDIDPTQKVTFSEPAEGVGAKYEWVGNDQVGTGSMAITESSPEKVVMRLIFVAPWQSEADAGFTVKPEGEGVSVTWTYDQQADLSAKLMSVFINMDDMLGADYEKGLAALKVKVEADAAARKAAEAAAEAEAARLEAEAAAAAAAAAAAPAGEVAPG